MFIIWKNDRLKFKHEHLGVEEEDVLEVEEVEVEEEIEVEVEIEGEVEEDQGDSTITTIMDLEDLEIS